MKLALCLPGGGACGRWQTGVLKYLYDMGMFKHVELVCGTSVGGLNTLLVGKYRDNFEKGVELWERIKSNKDIYNGMLQFNNVFDFFGMIGQIFKSNKGKSVLDPVGLYQILDREFGNMALRDLKVPVIITTTDLSKGERLIFSTENNPDYKCAELGRCTSAIPLAFPAVELYIDNKKDLCVDGGLGRNNPVEVAIEAGATHIILIGTSPDIYPRKEVKNGVIDVALRIQDIIMRIFEEEAWEEKEYREKLSQYDAVKYPPIKILDIYPDTDTGSALDFSNVTQLDAGKKYARENCPMEALDIFLK